MNAAGTEGTITFANVPVGSYQFKVTNGSSWDGNSKLSADCSNLYAYGSDNICFSISTLQNITISYDGSKICLTGSVGNDYRDTAMSTIALQTKVESVDFALKLIFEAVDKLAKDGPAEDELAQAKKALIESLPSLFDSPSSTAIIFAKGELLGKSDDHYLDYVKEINAVTPDQVKTMIAKYFDKSKMTISIVGPVSKFDALKPFTVVPMDSLEFRN